MDMAAVKASGTESAEAARAAAAGCNMHTSAAHSHLRAVLAVARCPHSLALSHLEHEADTLAALQACEQGQASTASVTTQQPAQ